MATVAVKSKAQAASVRKQLSGLSDVHLGCRDGHCAWDKKRVVWREGKLYKRRMKCRDCGKVCTQTLNLDFSIRGRSYTYPDGYLLKQVRARPAQVRREAIQRTTVYPSLQAMQLAVLGPEFVTPMKPSKNGAK